MAAEFVTFQRDCDVVQIPAGNPITLPKGTAGVITQALGGAYTLQIPSSGLLVRVQGNDADAIGKPVPAAAAGAGTAGSVEERVWDTLRTCFDPEIPVNIVDLGLVYDLQFAPLPDGNRKIAIKMTLTAQGCGMGGSIAADARQKLLALEGIGEADVEIVWDPPWNPRMISPEGREILGID